MAESFESLLLDVRCYDSEHDTHSHDHHQLVLPVHGELELEIEGNMGIVSPNSHIAVIEASQRHGFSSRDFNQFVVADVPVAWANMIDSLPSFLPLTTSVAQYIRFIATHLAQERVTGQTQKQMLTLLLDLLSQQFEVDLNIDRRIKLAKGYLDEHLSSPVTLAEVANISCLSVRQLSSLFKAQIGMSVQQYLLQKRMKKALQLINEGQLSIQLVAEQVGYQSLAAFSHRFSRYFGHPPSHYRG